jgi:hypothetical protein
VHVQDFTYTFMGSHIVIDLNAARWSTDEINKIWLDSAMDVAPPLAGLTQSRTTEQDISWLIVGFFQKDPLHWPASQCPAISGVPDALRRQALSAQMRGGVPWVSILD